MPPIERHDYLSPNLVGIRPDAAFPHMIARDPADHPWPWLRREIPHRWYCDRRAPGTGFVSRDEAAILHNTALRFPGQPALEIGCWLGWSACHLALGGVELDVIDPVLNRPDFRDSVESSLAAAGVKERVHLYPGQSPETVYMLASLGTRWPLIFIDGDHEGDAPRRDAEACATVAADDALILLHDLASPHVAAALDHLRDHGWNTLIYHTMQIMAAAWRGNITPLQHTPDPALHLPLPAHLAGYAVSA